jgi:hypothetical protein
MSRVVDFFAFAGMVLMGWWLLRLARRIVLRSLVIALDLLLFLMSSLRAAPSFQREGPDT